MIRVGTNGKPKLTLNKAYNDMGSFSPSNYTVNDYFYMSLEEYMEKLEFETFDISRVSIEKEKAESGELYSLLVTHGLTASHQADRLISKAGGQIWQFNAVNKNLDGYIRSFVMLGEKQMVRWSWFDAYVKLPALKVVANVLNVLIKSRVKRELTNWQNFLEKIRE